MPVPEIQRTFSEGTTHAASAAFFPYLFVQLFPRFVVIAVLLPGDLRTRLRSVQKPSAQVPLAQRTQGMAEFSSKIAASVSFD